MTSQIREASPVFTARPRSVSEISEQIKCALHAQFDAVWVVGEVSDLAQPQSGHVYLTLKDESAQIRAVIWRSTAQRIPFSLEDGLELICFGEIDVYPPRGSYQLIIRKVELRGEGAAQRALRKLKSKLQREGLFDTARKQPLPTFPRRVAVVTSPSGAAITDFLQVARRRWLGSEILVVPVSVQGETAAEEIVKALRQTHRLRPRPDVLVIARGGGSVEDLHAFNDEALVRAIAKSRIPIVSAVGHEIDVTLSDLVADRRALSPTEAAELVLPSQADVKSLLEQLSARMGNLLRSQVVSARQRLDAIASRPVMCFPYDRTRRLARDLDELQLRAAKALQMQCQRSQRQLTACAAQLEALSPLAVLGRGYSVTHQHPDNVVVDSIKQTSPGSRIVTRVRDGEIVSLVESTQATSDLLSSRTSTRGKKEST